jgi:hypothetical protein
VKPLTTEPEVKIVVSVDWIDRWQVYKRLQELDFSCACGMNKPLTVDISNVAAAIQLWSVVQQFTAPRCELILGLERCWYCDA